MEGGPEDVIKITPRRLFLLGLSVAPCIGPLLLIRFLGTKAIIWDEWGLPYLFQKIKNGELLLNVVWSGNHEHRLVFPRLLFCLVAVTTKWDPRVVMYCSVLVMVIAWAAFVWTFLYKFGDNGLRSIVAIGLCSLLVFSPIQHANWLWAFQFAFFLIIGCQLLALSILATNQLSLLTRMAAAGLFCLIASFSSAQGLFSWIALAPLVVAVCSQRKAGWAIVTGWLLTAVGVWTIYLQGLDTSQSGGVRVLLAHPLDVLRFVLVLITNPFVGELPLAARFVVGCGCWLDYHHCSNFRFRGVDPKASLESRRPTTFPGADWIDAMRCGKHGSFRAGNLDVRDAPVHHSSYPDRSRFSTRTLCTPG